MSIRSTTDSAAIKKDLQAEGKDVRHIYVSKYNIDIYNHNSAYFEPLEPLTSGNGSFNLQLYLGPYLGIQTIPIYNFNVALSSAGFQSFLINYSWNSNLNGYTDDADAWRDKSAKTFGAHVKWQTNNNVGSGNKAIHLRTEFRYTVQCWSFLPGYYNEHVAVDNYFNFNVKVN